MIDLGLKEFFNNLESITSFERKKKVYELTNDLDSYLLSDLKKETFDFFKEKVDERAVEYSERHGALTQEALEENIMNYPFEDKDEDERYSNYDSKNGTLNDYFDCFLYGYDYSYFEDIIEESSVFLYELDELIVRAGKLSKNKEFHNSNNDDEVIDFSDSTISSKIIFFKKLGIIDFLRKQNPFNTSVNSIASVLSAVTGGKPSTIQSMLNPILSENVSNKNNPMNSVNTVKVVENKLIQIGFNIKP